MARKEEAKREASKRLFPQHQHLWREADIEYRQQAITALVAEVPRVLRWLEIPSNWKGLMSSVRGYSSPITADRMIQRVADGDFGGLYLDIYEDTRKHLKGISARTDHGQLPPAYHQIWPLDAFKKVFVDPFSKYDW